MVAQSLPERVLVVTAGSGPADEVDAALLDAVDVPGRLVCVADPASAPVLLEQGWDAVVLRWRGNDEDVDLLRRVHALEPRPGALAVPDDPGGESLRAAFRAGVDDVVLLPLDRWELDRVLPQVVAVGFAAQAEVAAVEQVRIAHEQQVAARQESRQRAQREAWQAEQDRRDRERAEREAADRAAAEDAAEHTAPGGRLLGSTSRATAGDRSRPSAPAPSDPQSEPAVTRGLGRARPTPAGVGPGTGASGAPTSVRGLGVTPGAALIAGEVPALARFVVRGDEDYLGLDEDEPAEMEEPAEVEPAEMDEPAEVERAAGTVEPVITSVERAQVRKAPSGSLSGLFDRLREETGEKR